MAIGETQAFTRAFEKKDLIFFSGGKWSSGSITERVQWFFFKEKDKLEELAKQWSLYLDHLERYPAGKRIHRKEYKSVIVTSQKVQEAVTRTFPKDSSSCCQLNRRVVALNYRLAWVEEEDCSEEDLISLVTAWRRSQWQFEEEDQELSNHDRKVIKELCTKYPKVVPILIGNRPLRNEFFKWALRDHNPVDVFVEYPRTQIRIKQANLSVRIAYQCKSCLRLEMRDGVKDVTLPFNVQGKKKPVRISLLNEKRTVTFRGNYTLSIGEVLDTCQGKYHKPGNIEFFAGDGGFENWNGYEWGYWDTKAEEYVWIDLDQENWWKQLRVVSTCTVEEAKQRYGKHLEGDKLDAFKSAIDQQDWFFASRATRSTPDYNFNGCHAFILIGIWEGGVYKLYDFGKYPADFPAGSLEYLWFFAGAHEGVFQFPDDSIFYRHRQHAFDVQPLSDGDGPKLMKIIAGLIKRAIRGEDVFIWPAEGCAKCVKDDIVGQLDDESEEGYEIPRYEKPIIDAKGDKLWGTILGFTRKFPIPLQNIILAVVFLILGSYRKRNGKSYFNGSNWPTKNIKDKASMCIPSFIFKEKSGGK